MGEKYISHRYVISVPVNDTLNPGSVKPIARLTVSPPEAAEMLGVSRVTVYRLITTGKLRTVPGLRIKLIPVRDLEAFVAGAK